MFKTKPSGKILSYLPTVGILIFVGFYIYASKHYPGGSHVDKDAIGFVWRNNHWCNLMAEQAINGAENPARPIAITGLVILCSSLTLFFFQFAHYFEKNRNWHMAIKVSGTLAMVSAIFIFTPWHDVFTTILSVCGIIVIVGMIRALHRNKWTVFRGLGLLSVGIIGLNNLFYYSESLVAYSPLIQKAGFLLILSWTIGLNLRMHRKTSD